jgi:streptomycin 6-kinase
MSESLDGSFPLPRNLVEGAPEDKRESWLASLPARIATVAETWSLSLSPPFQPGGQTAWVAPVRDATGTEMVLRGR